MYIYIYIKARVTGQVAACSQLPCRCMSPAPSQHANAHTYAHAKHWRKSFCSEIDIRTLCTTGMQVHAPVYSYNRMRPPTAKVKYSFEPPEVHFSSVDTRIYCTRTNTRPCKNVTNICIHAFARARTPNHA